MLKPQEQNWDNFCRYQAIGDWYATGYKYSPQGEVDESFQCIRSLRASKDKNEVYHQNHYTYADGRTVSKTFGPYQKPLINCLFLENSFSWGTNMFEVGSFFGFETGFSHENRRVSSGIFYNEQGNLAHIKLNCEHLGSYVKEFSDSLENQGNNNWKGISQQMTPDYKIAPAIPRVWKPLKQLGEGYFTFNLAGDVSVSGPPMLEKDLSFLTIIEWLVNPSMLQRGIRYYEASEFRYFTFETFTSIAEV